MPRQTSPEIAALLSLPDSGAWVWLVEIEVSNDRIARLTPRTTGAVWRGSTWRSYPMSVPEVPEESDTASHQFSLVLWNVDEILTDLLRAGDLDGRRLSLYLVHEGSLDDDDALWQVEAEVLAASVRAADATVTLTVGARNWLTVRTGRRFNRSRCIHAYGGPGCGYNVERTGALSTCTHLLTGTSGCTEHGDNEAAAGLLVLHPQRFLGFPGIPRRNRG